MVSRVKRKRMLLNRRTRIVILTAAIAVVLIFVYMFGIFIPDEAISGSFLNAKQPPSWEHFFGTDALGRDLFLRTLKGLSVSMTVGVVASLISAVIAVFVGIVSATGSRVADTVVNWVIDLVMSVPHTVLIFCISHHIW